VKFTNLQKRKTDVDLKLDLVERITEKCYDDDDDDDEEEDTSETVIYDTTDSHIIHEESERVSHFHHFQKYLVSQQP